MVNYDIPWNPARLEQRMGRIHRYGQEHDPVVIVNLIAGKTREGRVLKTLLDKLETMRRQLDSDKVFDVVGRLFEGISFKDYLDLAVSEDDAEAVVRRLEGPPHRGSDPGPRGKGAFAVRRKAAMSVAALPVSTKTWSGRAISDNSPATFAGSWKRRRRCFTWRLMAR